MAGLEIKIGKDRIALGNAEVDGKVAEGADGADFILVYLVKTEGNKWDEEEKEDGFGVKVFHVL